MMRLQVPGWLLALAGIACAVGLAVDRADAQGAGLVYHKRLDPSFVPPPLESGPEMASPLSGQDAVPTGRVVSLPGLVPAFDVGGDRDAPTPRIINGKAAPAGKWKSTVNIHFGFKDGVQGYCGGTLIDPSWILTAAHCVFRGQAGGVKNLQWVVAYASDVRAKKGLELHAKTVIVHEKYDEPWILNDVALIELARPAKLPRQKLAGGAGQATFLAAGRPAAIVGWGATKPWKPGTRPGPGSTVLLEASVPMTSKSVCDEFRKKTGFGRPGRPVGPADFCAGYGQHQKPLTCNGDSGGPIFVGGANGEPIQAGTVSWGWAGCPTTYAAFANVGHFEPWIRKHVQNAVFVLPGAQSSPVQKALGEIAGAEPDGPPSPHGQCSVDIGANGEAVNRIKVGARLTVQVSTAIGGQLAVFKRTENRMVQLFPNRHGGRNRLDPVPTSVQPGNTVAIPAPTDGFSLEVTPPEGRYEIVAMVVPETVNLAGIVGRHEDMRPIADFEGVLARIAAETRQAAASAPDVPRAVCTRQFVVE